MEVRVIPMSGCLMVVLGVFTLGVAPLSIKLKERGWPKSLDEQGLVTRGGKRIAWGEFTEAVKIVTKVQGTVTERYEFRSPKGVVPVVVHRLERGPEALQYIWDRLPEKVRQAS